MLTPSLKGGHDFAFGGAQTGPTDIKPANPADLPDQVAQYALEYPRYQGALYTLDIGANDSLKVLDELRAERSTSKRSAPSSGKPRPTPSRPARRSTGSARVTSYFTRFPDLGLTP